MKKITILSGAGLDQESGIATFRDTQDGLWDNNMIEEVATKGAWKKDKSKVLEFCNIFRRKLKDMEPNVAHKAIFELSKNFDVINVTQNISDLLEKAGCKDVLHLHGNLTQARDSFYQSTPNNLKNFKIINIGYDDINVGDKCSFTDSQLRPNIVLFEEYPFYYFEALEALISAEIIIVVGTSLPIGYVIDYFNNVSKDVEIYYVDPNPSDVFDVEFPKLNVTYIREKATIGMVELVNKLNK